MVEWRIINSTVQDWALSYDGPPFHALLCDPPYELAFMNKAWDRTGVVFNSAIWSALAAHLLPGAFGMAFASARGWHRLACAIEDAGLIIHPSVFMFGWVTGQGFPKATRIDTLIDKRPGAAGRVIEIKQYLEVAILASGKTQEQINRECGFTACSFARWRSTARPDPWRTVLPNWRQWQRMKMVIGFGDDYDDVLRAVERGVIGQRRRQGVAPQPAYWGEDGDHHYGQQWNITLPATDLAQVWANHRYGLQALKPALEPIIVFQKPYEGRPVDSIVCHGSGAFNIDGGRIAASDGVPRVTYHEFTYHGGDACNCYSNGLSYSKRTGQIDTTTGRWPANFTLAHHPDCQKIGVKRVKTSLGGLGGVDSGLWQAKQSVPIQRYNSSDDFEVVDGWRCVEGCPVKALDEQSGFSKGGGKVGSVYSTEKKGLLFPALNAHTSPAFSDEGGVSRFFFNADWSYEVAEQLAQASPVRYVPKASRSERDKGLQGHNAHPTVKPIALAEWLASLLLPPSVYAPRRILVPFAGVMSEVIGAVLAGWDSILAIEQEGQYCEMGEARVRYWSTERSTAAEIKSQSVAVGEPAVSRSSSRAVKQKGPQLSLFAWEER